MHLKYLSSINLKATPWFSFSDMIIDESNIVPETINENDLIISCVQGVYGYRTGMFGYGTTYVTEYIKRNNLIHKTYFLKNLLNNNFDFFNKNNLVIDDLSLISTSISLLNRYIPFLNYGIWDNRRYLINNNQILKYRNINNSLPGMFNFSSLLLDNGCCIYSNRNPDISGYEKLEIHGNKVSISDYLSNKGIVWSFYKTKDNDKGILVITFNLSDDNTYTTKLLEVEQIINLQIKLEQQLFSQVKEYETYIIGDFKFKFNEDDSDFKLYGFNIFKQDTNYVLYHQNKDYKMNIELPLLELPLFRINIEPPPQTDDEPYIYIDTEIDVDTISSVEIDTTSSVVSTGYTGYTGEGISIINPILNYFNRLSPSSSSSGEWTKV